jgi:hypothetical protein
MLDFTLASPKRFLNGIVTLAQPGTIERAPADRRIAPGTQPPSSLPRRRRRHDAMNCGRQAPLTW